MKKWLKRLATLVLLLIVGMVLLGGFAWWRAGAELAKVYTITDAPLPMADADLDRGRHLFASRGCAECHGADGHGEFDIDAGPVFQARSANISPTGLGDRYDANGLAAVIRHGIRDDGTTLIFMPAPDWAEMSDRDTADLVAYVQTLSPVGSPRERSSVGPLGRVLWLFGQIDPLLPATIIDHSPRQRGAPVAAATAEYGAYLVPMCQGCHLPNLVGGIEIEPGAPKSANINRAEGGLADWSEADFITSMRTGKRPDGTDIANVMPWRTVGAMNDTELQALWAYLGKPSSTMSSEKD